jgi:hypothetical protein
LIALYFKTFCCQKLDRGTVHALYTDGEAYIFAVIASNIVLTALPSMYGAGCGNGSTEIVKQIGTVLPTNRVILTLLYPIRGTLGQPPYVIWMEPVRPTD